VSEISCLGGSAGVIPLMFTFLKNLQQFKIAVRLSKVTPQQNPKYRACKLLKRLIAKMSPSVAVLQCPTLKFSNLVQYSATHRMHEPLKELMPPMFRVINCDPICLHKACIPLQKCLECISPHAHLSSIFWHRSKLSIRSC
jgi:hypothetical protein